jgi:hypothetical protein
MKYILAILLTLTSSAYAQQITHEHGYNARITYITKKTESTAVHLYGEMCGGQPVDEDRDLRYMGGEYSIDGRGISGAFRSGWTGVRKKEFNLNNYDRRYFQRTQYGYRRQAGDCHMGWYGVSINIPYYEVYYDYNGYLGSVRSEEYPRGKYIFIGP